MASAQTIKPLLPDTTREQAIAILGAMRSVAESGRGWTASDAKALASAAPLMLNYSGPLDTNTVPPVSPEKLAAALANAPLREDAVKFLTVMSMIDAPMDKAKLDQALAYAKVLDVHERFVGEVADAAQDRLKEALADMVLANMDSILGHPWEGNEEAWLLPYQGAKADPAFVARFEKLGQLPETAFGHYYWQHFKKNSYAFPGDPKALNFAFCGPHDTVHVLTGYNTTGGGEILVSTFTSSMHRRFPMAGHVLPVIFSWHLKIQINSVAGSKAGELDPSEVWRAWAAGAQSPVDSFAPGWDFWANVEKPIEAMRAEWRIPAGGLREGLG